MATLLTDIVKADVKAYFGILTTTTTYDSMIDAHLPGIRELVKQYCRHDFQSAARTNENPYIKPLDTEFYLDHYPVASVSSLTEGGNTLTEDEDFYVDKQTGRVEKIFNDLITNPARTDPAYWNAEQNAIVVNYTGGHALTDDVCMAIYEMVGVDCGLKKRTWTDNEGVERVSVLASYPKQVEDILKRHRQRVSCR
jgi:hypothetical protein